MKNIKTTLALLFVASLAQAQVELQIRRFPETATYLVSAMPSETYPAPLNTISTAQVTIKVPTGGFEIEEIQSLYGNAHWILNGRYNAPKESPDFDYLSFGLENLGSTAYVFQKNTETILFALRARGKCTGDISLVDNAHDVFLPPNSMQANVGNEMTILGAGGDAYVGNRSSNTTADCFESVANYVQPHEILIYPNPILNDTPVHLAFQLDEKTAIFGEILLFDAASREVFRKTEAIKPGLNDLEIPFKIFPAGVYRIELRDVWVRPLFSTILKIE
jgi:hypothetical protein